MFSSVLATIFPLLVLASSSPLINKDYPDPICSGDCSNQVHDPAVVRREDGTYFRFTTLDLISIATAPSIGGPWTLQGSVLSEPSIIDLKGNDVLWAPDCFLYKGTYYLYYSVSSSGSPDSDIGVATSTTMEPGSWTDHGSIGIPANEAYNKIDANLFQYHTDSPFYLAFGSYWENLFQVPMETPPVKIDGEITPLERNFTVRPDDLPIGPQEGPYQFWYHVDGKEWYYLFFSSGACCYAADDLAPPGEEYKVMVCRSDNPTGGFVDKDGVDCLKSGGSLVLGSHGDVYAPGGQGVMYDPGVGSVVMYYHYVKRSVGYAFEDFFFGYNKLDFSSGWPVVVA